MATIPPNELLKLGKSGLSSRAYTIRVTPLDVIDMSNCYEGEIVYDPETQQCYMYSGNLFKGWIKIETDTLENTDKREDALTCKTCGARLTESRCSYCGTFSWAARDYLEY